MTRCIVLGMLLLTTACKHAAQQRARSPAPSSQHSSSLSCSNVTDDALQLAEPVVAVASSKLLLRNVAIEALELRPDLFFYGLSLEAASHVTHLEARSFSVPVNSQRQATWHKMVGPMLPPTVTQPQGLREVWIRGCVDAIHALDKACGPPTVVQYRFGPQADMEDRARFFELSASIRQLGAELYHAARTFIDVTLDESNPIVRRLMEAATNLASMGPHRLGRVLEASYGSWRDIVQPTIAPNSGWQLSQAASSSCLLLAENDEEAGESEVFEQEFREYRARMAFRNTGIVLLALGGAVTIGMVSCYFVGARDCFYEVFSRPIRELRQSFAKDTADLKGSTFKFDNEQMLEVMSGQENHWKRVSRITGRVVGVMGVAALGVGFVLYSNYRLADARPESQFLMKLQDIERRLDSLWQERESAIRAIIR